MAFYKNEATLRPRYPALEKARRRVVQQAEAASASTAGRPQPVVAPAPPAASEAALLVDIFIFDLSLFNFIPTVAKLSEAERTQRVEAFLEQIPAGKVRRVAQETLQKYFDSKAQQQDLDRERIRGVEVSKAFAPTVAKLPEAERAAQVAKFLEQMPSDLMRGVAQKTLQAYFVAADTQQALVGYLFSELVKEAVPTVATSREQMPAEGVLRGGRKARRRFLATLRSSKI